MKTEFWNTQNPSHHILMNRFVLVTLNGKLMMLIFVFMLQICSLITVFTSDHLHLKVAEQQASCPGFSQERKIYLATIGGKSKFCRFQCCKISLIYKQVRSSAHQNHMLWQWAKLYHKNKNWYKFCVFHVKVVVVSRNLWVKLFFFPYEKYFMSTINEIIFSQYFGV